MTPAAVQAVLRAVGSCSCAEASDISVKAGGSRLRFGIDSFEKFKQIFSG